MTSSSIPYLLQYLMTTGPTLLVAVVGLLLTVINWRKLGSAALPAAGGFGLYLVSSLAHLFMSTFLMEQIRSAGNVAGASSKFGILGVVNGTLHAVALACLLAALLVPRTPAE